MRSWLRGAAAAAAVIALVALLALAALPSTYLGPDGVMALAWGAEIARGGSPDVSAPLLPVQHPLPTLLGAALYPLGPDGMIDGLRLLGVFFLAGFGYAVFRLGDRLGGTVAGALAVGLVFTRPQMAIYGQGAAIDVPFTALVLLAVVLALERPLGNRWRVLGLLAVAGLLRPEAWLLSVAYGAWLIYRRPGRAAAVAAAALAAPLLWAGFDLIVSGDPFATAANAGDIGGPQDRAAGFPSTSDPEEPSVGVPVAQELEVVLRGLGNVLGWPLSIGVLALTMGALWRWGSERELPGRDPLVVTLMAFAILGALVVLVLLGFPFDMRFVLLPAVALAAVVAAAVIRLAPAGPWRVPLALAAVAIALLPREPAEIEDNLSEGRTRANEQADVRALVGLGEVRDAARECIRLGAGGDRYNGLVGVGVLAIEQRRDPAEIPLRRDPADDVDSLLLFGSAGGRGAGSDPRAPIAERGPWTFWSRCPRDPS